VFESIADWSIALVTDYGWVALFVFVILETAWIMHFAPSEVVIPVAAVPLISGPTTFAIFVGVLTVASILGSLLCYWLFGINADRVLARYEHHLPSGELDRGREWFDRHGTGIVFWGRLVPVVRTPLSVPAGIARMDLRRFTVYSAAGWFVYWIPISLLGYSGEEGKAPIELAWAVALSFAGDHPFLAGALCGLGLVATAGVVALWRRAEFTFVRPDRG
jgi:membrane protein DedA with SNARE-associated domain